MVCFPNLFEVLNMLQCEFMDRYSKMITADTSTIVIVISNGAKKNVQGTKHLYTKECFTL